MDFSYIKDRLEVSFCGLIHELTFEYLWFLAGEESEGESQSLSDEDEEADEKDQFQVDDEKEELEQGLTIPGQTDGKQSELVLLRVSKTH